LTRSRVIDELIESSEGIDLVRAGVRVGNILAPGSHREVKPDLLRDQAEKELWDSFNRSVVGVWQKNGSFGQPANRDEYLRLLDLLRAIVPHVHNLFDRVMINDPDQQLRDNRHALLSQIDRYFKTTADFPKLQPLLP